MTAIELSHFHFTVVDKIETNGEVETFFAQCDCCGLGGNCRESHVYRYCFVPVAGLQKVDTLDICDTCRYVIEYGEEPEG